MKFKSRVLWFSWMARMLSVRLVTQTELSASKTKPVASPRVVQGEQRKNLFQLLTTVAKKKMPSLKLLCSAYCF